MSGRLYLIVLGTRHDEVVRQRLRALPGHWRDGGGEHFTVDADR